jgi:hypothetical protein
LRKIALELEYAQRRSRAYALSAMHAIQIELKRFQKKPPSSSIQTVG